MRKTIFGCLGAAAVAFALQFTMADVQAGFFNTCNPCDEVCSPCDEIACDPCEPVCGVRAGGWFLNGHMEAGFFANEYGQKSTYNSYYRDQDWDSGNTNLLQNTRLTGAQVNQVYLSMGKKVDGRRGLDIGGTVDFTWGSDAYMVQAAGMEYNAGHWTTGQSNIDTRWPVYGRWGQGDYYSSFAQAFLEAEYGRWNVKAGKFYAPFGSSHYKSTENFFYSWASTAIISPHVGGGVYTTYEVSDRLSVIGGWVQPEEFGESSDNNAVLGGFVWTPSKRFSLQYSFAAGKDKYGTLIYGDSVHRTLGIGSYDDYYVHTLLATTQFSKRLKYVFDWTYFEYRTKASGFVANSAYMWGLNNELIYQINNRWAVGTRFGMLNDYFGDEENWYTIGLGANWTPNKWLTVKPEIRYDWFSKGDNYQMTPFNAVAGPSKKDQFSGGMSAVVKF